MLKQKTWLGIFFDMIFNHVVAQWSEKACFFMSKQALTLNLSCQKIALNSPIRYLYYTRV